MLRIVGIIRNIAKGSVCKLRDPSSHEMIKVERYSTIRYSLIAKWIKSIQKGLSKSWKIRTHDSQDAEHWAQVGSTPHVLFWRANHSLQSPQQGQRAEIGKMSITWRKTCSGEKLTEIVLWALVFWSNTALITQSTEGWKNEATSVLKQLY